ncbi:MAG: Nif3-like dinuclear metal center hexameric protein [Campylobacteraceae bacterium]
MKICEIYDELNNFSPFELQETWDNSGLLVGDFDDEFEEICLCLDISLEIIKKAKSKTLFIAHHPLIFKGLKKINSTFPASVIKEMIKKDCSLIAMHTNIDKTHLSKYVTEKVLEQKIVESEEFVCYFDTDMSFDELVLHVKKKLNLLHVRVVKADKKIKRVALVTGSGADFIENINADCFLTGDLKYHQAFSAKEDNLALIDIGHYESELFFMDILNEYLKKFGIKVIMSDCKNPFEYR